MYMFSVRGGLQIQKKNNSQLLPMYSVHAAHQYCAWQIKLFKRKVYQSIITRITVLRQVITMLILC